MKIESVRAFPVRVKMKEVLKGGTFSYGDYQACLVRVRADGVEGWGEAMSRTDPRVNALLADWLGKGLVGSEVAGPVAAWTTST